MAEKNDALRELQSGMSEKLQDGAEAESDALRELQSGMSEKQQDGAGAESDALRELQDVVRALRAPDGCPWDRAQTHESLRPCMMEEAAELLASIRIYRQTGNAGNMKEELGDVLLQVVMHSRIAEEEGLFTLEDVIRGVSEKMIRRHPHIFGEDASGVGKSWDEIKAKEKEEQDWAKSPLREIPQELPSLTRAVKVLKKADKLYRPQPSCDESLREIQTLAGQLQGAGEQQKEEALAGQLQGAGEQQKEEALAGQRRGEQSFAEPPQGGETLAGQQSLQACLGKLLLSVSNVCRLVGVSPEMLLQDEIEKCIEELEGQTAEAAAP